jgi:hypothetical protein
MVVVPAHVDTKVTAPVLAFIVFPAKELNKFME